MPLFHRKPRSKGFLDPKPDLSDFAWAYHSAAATLVEAIEAGSDRILVAFPVVFLYRHAIELKIKGLLIDYGGPVGIDSHAVLGRDHSLAKHLADLHAVAAHVGAEFGSEFASHLREFDGFDPKSMHFRYPIDKAGDPLLGEFKFDVMQFAAAAESVIQELDDVIETLASDKLSELIRRLGSGECR